MTTLKPKVKNKKSGKPSKSDSRNLDLSELRKPIEISVSSLKEAAKLLETGTSEIKELLTYEVNLLYECRICRSIFRSLLNLLSHKRAFCREKVNVTSESKSRDDKAKSSNIIHEDLQSSELDQSALDHLMNPPGNDRILRSQAPSKSTKKDLTSVLDMLQKKQVGNLDESIKQKGHHAEKTDCDQVLLQVLDSKRAAFQTLVEPNLSQDDLMENQVMELENILNQDTVVLGADGQIEKSDSPVHFYSNEETNKLVCDICSYAFATQKTLNSHIKIKHASIRDCYLCPCNPCTGSFTSYASVKRHLSKVHRKFGQELKSLTQQVEKRTLRTKAISILVNKKSKKPENSGNGFDESQSREWVERLDPQVQNDCISCREGFDDKSEMLHHSENCLGQNDVRSPEKITSLKEVFLDNNLICEDIPVVEENFTELSTPEACEIISSNVFDYNQRSSPIDLTSNVSFEKEVTNDLSIRVQGVSSLSEEDWRKLPDWSSETEENSVNPTQISLSREVILSTKRSNMPLVTESSVLNRPEIIFMNVNNSKKRKCTSLNEGNGPVIQGEKWKKVSSREGVTEKVVSGEGSAQIFSEKIASISDHTKLECIACRKSFINITSLNRHMENHIKINRYRCNKCDFKSVSKNDCVGHCNKIHNAMNNRQALNEMISQVSQDQLTLSQEIIVDPSNLNSFEMKRAFSDMECRVGNTNSLTNVPQKHHNRQLQNSFKNWKNGNISRIISEPVNPSDTDTETEDREAVYRRIDSNPNLEEMIREIVIGSNSNIAPSAPNSNGVSQSLLQNNNLEKASEKKIDGYSAALGEIEYSDEENEIFPELYRTRSTSRLRSRSNSRIGKRSNSRASKRSNSRSANRSESQMETRSSSRLGKKLDSEGEDEITRELYKGKESSQISKQSNSRSESRILTRSRSRMGKDENNEDCWQDYSRDFSSEEKKSRSRSRTGKNAKDTRGRSVSRQSRGKPRGKPPTQGKTNRSYSRGREERSESFSSESSQVQRPVRNRVKHVDKDFIYDLEDVAFHKEPSYSPSSSSGKKSSNGSQFAQVNRFSSNTTKRLFVDEINFIQDISRSNSDSDLENSELCFRGFPRQPEILNVE